MKRLNNKKGFTLVELLAVIVVLAIVMGLAVVGITSVLDSTRKSAFASDAKSYIEGARALVRSDEATVMLGGSSIYTPACNQSTSQSKQIDIKNIKLDSGGTSPYGTKYKDDSSTNTTDYSYVKVTATYNTASGTCEYTYAVYLTDGTFKLGTFASPIDSDKVNGNCVSTSGTCPTN
ncbi:MAG: prepilin-type N-terminal cleavage/methylation domain-containing protein [Bacilli bacterium]|nr:prepilin-type N-terminal cleavage/methylation domain-containing protein [Bacilli bacterium]